MNKNPQFDHQLKNRARLRTRQICNTKDDQNQLEYKIFLPFHMWGDIYSEVYGGSEFESTIDFKLGADKSIEKAETCINKTLKDAKKLYESSGKLIIPIIVMPISNVLEYTQDIMLTYNDEVPNLKIIGPAFKTRDDVFLLLGQNSRQEQEKIIKFAPKVQKITSSTLARAFDSLVLAEGTDPIFNQSHENGGWEYRLLIETADQKIDRKNHIELGYHGVVAAGPELPDFLYDDKRYNWLIAVNLNLWICNKLAIQYFPRSVFCCLSETYDDNMESVSHFWDSMNQYAESWTSDFIKNIQNKKQKSYSYALPIQMPCGTEEGLRYVTQLADDIYAFCEFMDIAFTVDKLENARRLRFNDFLVWDRRVHWEIYRKRYQTYLIDRIMKDIVLNSPLKKYAEKELLDFERAIKIFLSKIPTNSTRNVDERVYFKDAIKNLLRALKTVETSIRKKHVRDNFWIIFNNLPDIPAEVHTTQSEICKARKENNEKLLKYYESSE